MNNPLDPVGSKEEVIVVEGEGEAQAAISVASGDFDFIVEAEKKDKQQHIQQQVVPKKVSDLPDFLEEVQVILSSKYAAKPDPEV